MTESITDEQKDVIEISKNNNVIVYIEKEIYEKPFFDGVYEEALQQFIIYFILLFKKIL